MFTRLREDIDCIMQRDPAARSRWEVLTCYPGVHALWMHRLAQEPRRLAKRYLVEGLPFAVFMLRSCAWRGFRGAAER